MKTKIVIKDDSIKNPDLPCLMKSTQIDIIVLFTGIDDINQRGKGVILHSTLGEKLPVGLFSDNWYIEDFIPFEDVLTLENTY